MVSPLVDDNHILLVVTYLILFSNYLNFWLCDSLSDLFHRPSAFRFGLIERRLSAIVEIHLPIITSADHSKWWKIGSPASG